MPSYRFRLVQGKYRDWYVTDVDVIYWYYTVGVTLLIMFYLKLSI